MSKSKKRLREEVIDAHARITAVNRFYMGEVTKLHQRITRLCGELYRRVGNLEERTGHRDENPMG